MEDISADISLFIKRSPFMRELRRHPREMDEMITTTGLVMADLKIPMIHNNNDDSHCDPNNYTMVPQSALQLKNGCLGDNRYECLDQCGNDYGEKNKIDQPVGPNSLVDGTYSHTMRILSDSVCPETTNDVRDSSCNDTKVPQSALQGDNGDEDRNECMEQCVTDYCEGYSKDELGGPQPLAVDTFVHGMSRLSDLFCNGTNNDVRRSWCNVVSSVASCLLLGLLDGKRMITAMLKFYGFILILLATIFMPRASAFVDDCQPNQLYDTQRLVCLDRCGRDNELTCPVGNFCSSRRSQLYDPSLCLSRCEQACDKTSYCDHSRAECRPCDTLCDGSDMDACRAYCYDIYITLSTTAQQPPRITCSTNQHYDRKRRVCLDRCGRNYELICPLQDFCSSNQLWSDHYEPPFCLNRCIQACNKTSYCHHDSALCRPCDTLCDGSDVDACRAYCYDVYITLTTAAPQSPLEICSAYQYFDFDRKVCLDRCGVDNDKRCDVDQFCSTTVPWGVKIRPPACLNHCPHPCNRVTYCESTSHQCLPCADLCGDTNADLCRIHCFDVFMNVTSLDPPTANYSVLITPTSTSVLSTDIITSITIYQVILGLLSATIIVLIGALVIKHYQKGSTLVGGSDIETYGSDKLLIKVRHPPAEDNNQDATSILDVCE